MNNESRLAMEYLGESRSDASQRRYEVVSRFIIIYGIIPSLDRIVRDLPDKDKILDNIMLPPEIITEVNKLERGLQDDLQNPDIINKLDNLYEYAYRNKLA